MVGSAFWDKATWGTKRVTAKTEQNRKMKHLINIDSPQSIG
jgi:hypothetical protein